MSKNTPEIIIIGAGLAGLSAGCYAQMNGYATHIYEHHSHPGGVAAWWKRKDYLIDGGIHFVMGHKPGFAFHQIFRELGIVQTNKFVDITTYGRFVDETNGRGLEVTQDMNRFAGELKAFSPADSAIIDEIIAAVRAFRGADMSEFGLSKPPELQGLRDKVRDLWRMRKLFKYFGGKYGRSIEDFSGAIQDPWVRDIVKNLFLPEVPAWFIFMVLALLADGQAALLEGGCRDFVLAIEDRYKKLAGRIIYQATVEKILVQGDRAVGIRLSDGSEHRAENVVSAGDGYNTIFTLLDGRYADKKTHQRYETWKTVKPGVMVSFGLGREFAADPWMTVIKLKNPFKLGNQKIQSFILRIFNYSPKFAPPGKTVIQVEFETEWDFWNDLQRENRSNYDAEKERVAAEVLERLEAYYPGISFQVEVTDVSTPYTTWRYTLNHKGVYMAWLLTPEMLKTPIPRTLPGLKNFYMAGQWVMGGGVSSALYSGRHVAQLLCHSHKKTFQTIQP